MKTIKNNKIPSPRLSLLSLFLVLGILVGILSCEKLDDMPPPSAYVPPVPEPEPDPEGPCEFTTIVPELANGIDFECAGPEVTFFGEKDGSFTLDFVENPDTTGINTSKKVVEFTQTEGVEPWAGFFFNLASKVNFTELQTIKIKVYSPAADQIVLLKFENSADGSIAKEVQAVTTVADQWEELAFAFSPGDTDKFDRMVLFFDFNGTKAAPSTHYFDDIVMAEGAAIEEPPTDSSEPTTAAPEPTVDPLGVISIFSDTYTNVAGTDFNPNWGQGTVVTQELVDGNNTLKYATLNYQGTAFTSPIDVSAMTMIHVDYWTADSSALNLSLISTGPAETPYAFAVTTGQWVSMDIPLSTFSGVVDLSDVIQLKFDGNGTIYLDNIYFHAPPATEPTAAAIAPTVAEADVISIFSEAYTNVAGTDFNPDWGQGTVVTQELVDGNNILKYANLNYQGTAFTSAIDVSAMTMIHVDYWTADSSALNLSLISTGPAETPYAFAVTTGQWVSVDIPLSTFSGVVDLSDVIQLKFDGNGTIYLDNVYFHK